jgi:diguanylate cyclase (GGDEF)-like protein
VIKSFHLPLVALSVLVAVFVSHTALVLFNRLTRARSRRRAFWLAAGAVAMGSGIWATHFLGMLALSLPIKLTYNLAGTIWSLLIAIAASLVALAVAGRPRVSVGRLMVSAILLGAGISTMHYSGMAAIQIAPMIEYEPVLVIASVVVAVAGAFLALWLFLRTGGPGWGKFGRRASAACVLGAAIGGMHYTGMLASRFGPGSYCTGSGGADSQWLAIVITTLAFAVMAIMTVLLVYDGQLSARMRRYHRRLEAANAELRHSAHHDALTGLPNRLLLSERLEELIARSRTQAKQFALLLIDLDRFKDINDSLGHLAGDDLLRTVSIRIGSQLREHTFLARFGGDEFVLLLEDVRVAADAVAVASRLLTAIAKPLSLCDIGIHASASIGIAICPGDGADATTLLQRADAAMYHVKSNGRSGYKVFSNDIRSLSRERLELDDGLRRALETDQFELHYQPKVDVRTGRIEGAEALIRWRHPERGLISPDHFIPVAEETGFIVPLGEWVLREACRQAHSWQQSMVGRIRVAVNVSAKQFHTHDFADVVVAVIEETGLDPNLLELELTESTVMRDAEASVSALRRITSMGIAVSLDDFGTGYSSLSYLRRLPLTKLKIDRSFINELGVDSSSRQIVRAIVSLAHNLQLKVIAEGVETLSQLQFLRDAGCDKYQGYLCSPPIPALEFAKHVVVNRRRFRKSAVQVVA